MIESDADRRNMLLALGGSENVMIDSNRITGLFVSEPIQSAFDEVTVSGRLRSLHCLMSDIKSMGIEADARVEIPGDSNAYFISDIRDEDGMALIELRRE